MSAPKAFCTDYAIAQPLAGTGAMALRHLFVRWPKGKWRSPRYDSVGFDEVLKRAIHESYGPGRYVGLVESDGGPDLELVSFPDSRTALPADQAEAASLIRAWAAGTSLTGPTLQRPVILCCTDARVNACCARYGFPIYKALRDLAGAANFDVMQTTHFGGCHFAPSVIVMPQRARYGRLRVAEIPQFLETIAQGRYYLPCFRGRPEQSEIEQCAEIAALQWAEANGVPQDEVRLLEAVEEGAVGATAYALAGSVRLQILLAQQAFHMHGTCRSLDEGEGKIAMRMIVKGIAVV